jgi:type I restriction enzyme, S subunit
VIPGVPSGWREVELRDLLSETDERVGDRSDLPLLSITKYDGAVLAKDRFSRVLASKNLSRYRVAPRNSCVIDPMLLWDGVIALQHRFDAGIVSPDYRVFRFTSDTDPSFFDYLAHSKGMRGQYARAARGTNVRRRRISRDDFLAIRVSLPPPPEQRRIAATLTAVDESIRAHSEHLKAARHAGRALVAELTTRGSPPRRAPTKVTPIGEVPAHWQVATVADVAHLSSGSTPSRKCSAYFTHRGGCPWVKNMDLNDGIVLSTDEQLTDVGLSHSSCRLLGAGTVLVAMYGGFGQIGRTGVLGMSAVTNQAICALSLKDAAVEPRYVNVWLIANRWRWRRIAASSRKDPNITRGDVERFPIAIPPREEQQEIIRAWEVMSEIAVASDETGTALRAVKEAAIEQLLGSSKIVV